MTFVSYAQNFEDVMLWRALKHIEQGFYVDVGAQHPVVDSVSKAFYEHGWRGIHIEPVPEYADLLRQDRPDETVLQLALSDKEGTLELNALPDTGLSTFNDAYAHRHQKEHGFNVRRIRVPTLTLTQVLQEHAGKDIHWLKIDVEGYEAQVLKGWDSKHIRPWIIVVEATVPLSQTEAYQTWEQYLTKSRYSFVYFDGLNRFYVAAEHRELAVHFKSPPNVFDEFVLNGTASSMLCRKVIAERDDNAKLVAAAYGHQTGAMETELATQRGQTAQREHELIAARRQVNALEAKTQWLQNEWETGKANVAELSHRTGALETELATQRG